MFLILQCQSSKFEGLLTAVLGYVIIAFSLISCHVSFTSRKFTLANFYDLRNPYQQHKQNQFCHLHVDSKVICTSSCLNSNQPPKYITGKK